MSKSRNKREKYKNGHQHVIVFPTRQDWDKQSLKLAFHLLTTGMDLREIEVSDIGSNYFCYGKGGRTFSCSNCMLACQYKINKEGCQRQPVTMTYDEALKKFKRLNPKIKLSKDLK